MKKYILLLVIITFLSYNESVSCQNALLLNKTWTLSNNTYTSEQGTVTACQPGGAGNFNNSLSNFQIRFNLDGTFRLTTFNTSEITGNYSLLTNPQRIFLDLTNSAIEYTISESGEMIWTSEFYLFSPITNDFSIPAVNYITFTDNQVLPVEFLSVILEYHNSSKVKLKWSVNESSVSHYIVEKAINSVDFFTVSSIYSIGDGSNSYEHIDEYSSYENNYYRIKAVGFDGQIFVSKIVNHIHLDMLPKVKNLFPNPVFDKLSIKLDGLKGLSIIMTVSNVIGIKVEEQVFFSNENSRDVDLDTSHLSEGIYFIELSANGRIFSVLRFLKI